MKRIAVPIVVLAALAALMWRFPPIHIVRLAEANAARQAQAFDARAFAQKLWDERLTPAFGAAADAVDVVTAIKQDPTAARERFGRSVGLSRGYFYFLAGDGEIVSVQKNKVGVSLVEGQGEPDVVLATGPIFGNAVRDAPGLLNASDFANSQDYNGVAQELNRRVEALVIPPLVANARVGRQVHFVGCVEVRSEPKDLQPLKLVPLTVRFK